MPDKCYQRSPGPVGLKLSTNMVESLGIAAWFAAALLGASVTWLLMIYFSPSIFGATPPGSTGAQGAVSAAIFGIGLAAGLGCGFAGYFLSIVLLTALRDDS